MIVAGAGTVAGAIVAVAWPVVGPSGLGKGGNGQQKGGDGTEDKVATFHEVLPRRRKCLPPDHSPSRRGGQSPVGVRGTLYWQV